MIEITDELNLETTTWADQVIERFKLAMRNEETYLRWNDPLMYTKGGDAWIDESWWIETAEYLFFKQNHKYNPNISLEILLSHYPDKFRAIALARIEEWDKDPGDWDAWCNLVALTNPNHPFLIDLLNCVDSFYDWAFLANLGYFKAINACRELIIDCLSKANLFDLWELLHQLDKEVIFQILSEDSINKIHKEAKGIALRKFNLEKPSPFLVLFPSIKLGLEDVVDNLSNNLEFLDAFKDQLTYYGCGDKAGLKAILEWSFSSKKQLTQELVEFARQLPEPSPFIVEIYKTFPYCNKGQTEMDTLKDSIQLAIAWKRSLKTE
jgi:hypothetical protein